MCESRQLQLVARIAIAILFLATATHFAWARSDHSYRMDVPLTTERTINFDVQEGEFVLRGDPSVNAIRMEVSIDRFFIFRLGEQDILKKLIKVTHDSSESVTIATDIPRSLTNWGRAEYPIDFTVVVPTSMNIRLHDTSGIIEVSDLSGDVAIEDGSGTLSAIRLGGGLRINKESGDVRIANVTGKTYVNSRSGQMRIEHVRALEIAASEGNLYIEDAESANIHNGSGNIRLIGVKGDLVLRDSSGEIVVSDVSGKLDIVDTSGQIRVSKAGAVTIDDTDGNITVENVASLKVTGKQSGEVMVRSVSGGVEVPPKIKLKHQS